MTTFPHQADAAHADFEAWEDLICHTFVPLRARCSDDANSFTGLVDSAVIGSVTMADVSASHALVERTPRLIRSGDPELYKVGLQVSGTSVIEQDGRQACLRPGDLAVYDTSRPYRVTFSDDFRMTVAMFPRALVGLPEKQMRAMTAVRVPGDDRLAALIAPVLRGISSELASDRPIVATHLGDAVVDLVTAALAQQLECQLDPDASTSYRALVAKVRAFVDDRLGDPELCSQSIADAHFVSVRYLQKVFATEGTSVSSLIRTRRLERCRRDLVSAACQHLSIAQIGGRWGFPDAAHFSRLFRATYGVSPREFRKAVVAA